MMLVLAAAPQDGDDFRGDGRGPAMPGGAAAPMRGVRVATSVTLDIGIDALWRAVQTPALLLDVTRGLMRFAPRAPEGFPPVWENRPVTVDLFLLGRFPIGSQVIAIEWPQPEGARRVLRDNAHGDNCRRWDHMMILDPVGSGRTRYTDAVTVEAGPMTLPTAAFAYTYYVLRQRRLKRLVREGRV